MYIYIYMSKYIHIYVYIYMFIYGRNAAVGHDMAKNRWQNSDTSRRTGSQPQHD